MTHIALPLTEPVERPVKPALLRGWRGKCPACGEGRLMKGFLKVTDHCDSCGEDYRPQRADDGPAYITIVIVGHVVISAYLMLYLAFEWNPWIMVAITWIMALAMSIWLLPRTKGAMVAYQWAMRMHGFARSGPATRADDTLAEAAAAPEVER